MKIKSIKHKITIITGLCLLIAIGALVFISTNTMYSQAQESTMNGLKSSTNEQALEISKQLNDAMHTARSLSQILGAIKDESISLDIGRDEANAILQSSLSNNPALSAIYTYWEPDAFDGMDIGYENAEGHDQSGQFMPYWYKDNGSFTLVSYNEYKKNNLVFYESVKNGLKEAVSDPQFDDYSKEYIISLASPIIYNGTFYGITGVDISTSLLQKITDNFNGYDANSTMSIYSNNGIISSKKNNPDQIGKTISVVHDAQNESKNNISTIIANIQKGTSSVQNYNGNFRAFAPINIGNTNTPWSVKIEVPESVIFANAKASAKSQVIIGFVCLLLALLVMYMFAKNISAPINRISNVLAEISEGNTDLDVSVTSSDEIGVLESASADLIAYFKDLAYVSQRISSFDLTVNFKERSEKDLLGISFKKMISNLTEVMQQLKLTAEQVVSAATEVASSSEQMSLGAKEQTDQVTQISTAIEEMTITIVETSKNTSEANNAAGQAGQTAGDGAQIVCETIQGMQEIANVVRESRDSISKLAQSADQIGEIVGVIDDIADQTNLLALNAAIEAARAGEQGRGFAVVADEVRKLAERTGKATCEITDMIKGIQVDTKGAVQSMERGVTEVENGRELTDKAGISLDEVVNMSTQVVDMIQQIATASEEQSSAAEQISQNMENIASITRESATGAEQSAAAAEQLNQNAEGMKQIVEQFKLKKMA